MLFGKIIKYHNHRFGASADLEKQGVYADDACCSSLYCLLLQDPY
ncbi:MAG: hypothetical protein WAM16_07280 [Nitrososphaeraceae archaeon]